MISQRARKIMPATTAVMASVKKAYVAEKSGQAALQKLIKGETKHLRDLIDVLANYILNL